MWESFLEKVKETHEFPTSYTFKFLVKTAQKEELDEIFASEKREWKSSKKGNFYSLTMKKIVHSAGEVKDTYLKAEKVKDLISL